MSYALWESSDDSAADEDQADAQIRRLAQFMVPWARHVWAWGDGYGSGVLDTVYEELLAGGLPPEPPSVPEPRGKAVISASLRRAVFERDAYRCQFCGGWHELQADHVVPESVGGPTTLENLQTLCGACNRAKGSKP